MSFVQIIDFKTKQMDEVRAIGDEWEKSTEGKRTLRRQIVARDRNDPDRVLIFAFFDSYESAMENSALPETDELSGRMAKLMSAPPVFHDLDVIEERQG
jgi:hypothetical protein